MYVWMVRAVQLGKGGFGNRAVDLMLGTRGRYRRSTNVSSLGHCVMECRLELG